LRHHIFEERASDVALKQPVPILGEGRRHPDGSSMPSPTNQRNSKLYSSCSISMRSLRIEYSTCSNNARNKCSGGIDGRPVDAYRTSNRGDSPRRASSVMVRMARNG
jgi:hypothetical protein